MFSMESNSKITGSLTPSKPSKSNRSKISESSKESENFNPNVNMQSPPTKSATKTPKSAAKNPNPISSPSPRNKIRERKFVVAKKKNSKRENKSVSSTALACKCKVNGKSHKCLCVAYETLRASQEEFFKNRGQIDDQCELEKFDGAQFEVEEGDEKNPKVEHCDEGELGQNVGSETNVKRTREKLMEEARKSEPEPGSGKVMHLVKAFEKLLSIPKTKESSDQIDDDEELLEDSKKGMKWALPGLQQPRVLETQVSSSSFCPSDFFLTSESLGLDSRISSSLDSNHGSISSMNSGGDQRSRRNSSDSTGSFGGRKLKRRQLKVTSQKPFKLRTEQRGKSKEEEFVKKVQQMMTEEEKQRIPIAQGLPWTTDEPECLAKPPVKESTRPVDLVLHSDVRAVERSEFDNQVAEKLSFIEQYKMERERQQKLAEEEEIKRLRKELVPRAQPMPYFDRPFIPRRSEKNPTVPKEPRFHLPQHKKMKFYMSWNDMLCTSQQ